MHRVFILKPFILKIDEKIQIQKKGESKPFFGELMCL